MSYWTTSPGWGPYDERLSLAETRQQAVELRDLRAVRRGVTAITEALTAEQMCRRARILLAQHRPIVTIKDNGEMLTVPSGRPRIDPQRIADAMTEWVHQHPHHVASAA